MFSESVYKLVLDFWTEVRNKFMTFFYPVFSKVFFWYRIILTSNSIVLGKFFLLREEASSRWPRNVKFCLLKNNVMSNKRYKIFAAFFVSFVRDFIFTSSPVSSDRRMTTIIFHFPRQFKRWTEISWSRILFPPFVKSSHESRRLLVDTRCRNATKKQYN